MKRPTVPLWSHEKEVWILEGVVYKNHADALHNLSLNLFNYCDYLESKVVIEARALIAANQALTSENHKHPVCNICGGEHFGFECPNKRE